MEPNPLREGLEQERVPEPSCLVIFGASGDLTQRKLVPGLYSLAHDGLLPSGQTIIGFARAEMTDEQFRDSMKKACDEHARTRPVEMPGENLRRAVPCRRVGDARRTTAEAKGGVRRAAAPGTAPYYWPVRRLFSRSPNDGAKGMVNDPRIGPYKRVIVEEAFAREARRAADRVAVRRSRSGSVPIDHYLARDVQTCS